MLGRLLFNRIGAVIVGGLLIALGFVVHSGYVTCGGQTMSKDDVCSVTKDGTTTERSYDQQKSDTQVAFIVMEVGGTLALAGGIIVNVRHYRRKRATAIPANA